MNGCGSKIILQVLLVGLNLVDGRHESARELKTFGSSSWDCKHNKATPSRPHRVTITEFGAVGDGVTLNTVAFQNAIFYIKTFSDKGGAQLYVPKGKWLTGTFNLTSNMTLFLDQGAEILGSQESKDWPLVDPLPSYGRGRELPGGRYCSLIFGNNLTDVVITGNNGTIDGQGSVWWGWFRNKTLDFTRPHLLELMHSSDIIIANLTFKDSPFWTIHPVYCSNVKIQNLTILAPLHSPNTDGIDPDSSTDVCIEDCYISCGDDVIAIKSGWDEYGISYGRPSANIIIRRIIGQTHSSSGLAIGSEMSGGVKNVHAEDLYFFDSRRALRIKTAPGRGGYVKDVYIRNVTMNGISCGICFNSQYGDHPDDRYDPNALPVIKRITFKDIYGDNITTGGTLEGLNQDPYEHICLSNIVFNVTTEPAWNCTFMNGFSESVSPPMCVGFLNPYPHNSSICYTSRVRKTCNDL